MPVRFSKQYSGFRPVGFRIIAESLLIMYCPPAARTLHADAKKISFSAIAAVSPPELVCKALHFDSNTSLLSVNQQNYQLRNNVKVVAFGKAVLGMVMAVENLLGDHISGGVASVPAGTVETAKRAYPHHLPKLGSKIRICEGAVDNLPDAAAESAAREILSLARDSTEDDILIALISGGGSALLPCPIEGVSLAEKRQVIENLSKAGGSIHDLNTFRKALSQTKGGKLAEAAYPAKVLALILSDVIGDPIDIIASGPTDPHQVSAEEVLQLLEKFNLKEDTIPLSVLSYLRSKGSGPTETKGIRIEDGRYVHTQNIVIGSNRIATAAACVTAKDLGYDCHVWSHQVQGEARLLGEMYARLAHFQMFQKTSNPTAKVGVQTLSEKTRLEELCETIPDIKEDVLKLVQELSKLKEETVCLIGAGEPTVNVTGSGKGGRNQELALAFAIKLNQILESTAVTHHPKCTFLAIGTDGQDGPCDVAGVAVDSSTIPAALKQGLDPVGSLNNNDSYTFFSELGLGKDLIRTGLTGTNVMDLHVLLFSNEEMY